MNLLIAIALALGLVTGTTLFHFEALEKLGRGTARHKMVVHGSALKIVLALILVHLAEVLFFALAYRLGAGPLHIGTLTSRQSSFDGLTFFYYSAETYSTLGYGDFRPTGGLRLLASVEPLVGLLLLAWSGAFLFSLVQRASASRS